MSGQNGMHEAHFRILRRPFDFIATHHQQFAAVQATEHSPTVEILDLHMSAMVGHDTAHPTPRRHGRRVGRRHVV